MGDGLHIKLIQGNENQSKFESSFGSLVLNSASVFQVTVKEYEDKRKPIDDAAEKADKRAREKWNARAKEKWTKEKLQENWEANQDVIKKEKDKSSDILITEFKDVNWVWVVAAKQLNKAELSHNESFSKGISGNGIYNIHFPKVLEGGGIAYLEAFLPLDGVKATKPFGVFVQATGVPKIVRVEWTDFDYNPLDKKLVSFYSEVLLHIYTEGLYGQELKIQLFDEDVFDDDELKFSGATEFEREVDIQKVHKKEYNKTGIADELVKSEQDKSNNTIEKEHYIQKITVEVFVDPKWKKEGGNVLKIYPTIKSKKTGKYFEKFSRECLDVSEDGDFYNTPKEVSNMPAVQSNINTNVANYHPCQYTSLDYIYEKDGKNETVNLYTEKQGVEEKANLEIGIIAGINPKKFTFKVDEKSNTLECRFHDKSYDHSKNIFSCTAPKISRNISITSNLPKSIEGTVFFDYDRLMMYKYFYLSNNFKNDNTYSHFSINSSSCRHQNIINFSVLPDIEWEVSFIITATAGFRVKAENTTFTRLKKGLTDYSFRGITAEQSGKLIRKGGLGYSLNIKYSINNGSFYSHSSLDFIRSIEKIIGTYNAIAGFAILFKGDENDFSSAAIKKSVIKKITFDIESPAVVFLLKWKYDYAKKTGKVVVNYTGALGFKPLIGLKIGFDITQNLSVFGIVGTAIQWILDIVEDAIKQDIYILAEVGAAINYDVGLSYNEVDGFAPNTKQRWIIDLTFTFKAGIKNKNVVFIPDTRRMEGNTIPTNETEQETFKIEGAVTTGIRYIEEHGIEKGKGKYTATHTRWLGAEMTLTLLTLAHNRKQNKPPNDQFKNKFIIMSPRDIEPLTKTFDTENK